MGARYGAYYMDQQVIGHKGAVHTQSHTPTHKYMTTKIHLRASSTATRVRPISQVILFERTSRLSKDIMGDILQVLILFTLYLIVYIMVLCQWRVCCNSGVGAGLCTLQKTIFSILTWCHYQNGTAAPLKWDRIIPAAIINNCRVNDQISFKIHEGKGGRHHRRRPISLVHSLGIDHFYYNVPFFADEHELPRSCFTFRVYASPFSKCMKCASPRKKSL